MQIGQVQGCICNNMDAINQYQYQVLVEKHYTVWMVDGWMSVEQWWNVTDRGKLKYWEKNII